jgi:DNA-binding LacI/PurR family transcriptional regulator
MPVDMKTLAKMLGVSKTTVHRALTNSGRISPQTKARILELAKQLDYHPNNLARGLRSRRSGTIGILAVEIASSFYPGLMDGIEAVAAEKGYNVLLACSHGSPLREATQLDMLREKCVDGIIIIPVPSEANLSYYKKMLEAKIPFVLIDRYLPELDTHYVTTDNFQGGYIAGLHLIRLGRRKLGFVTTTSHERSATSIADRFAGLATAAEEHGLPPIQIIGLDTPDASSSEEFAHQAVSNFLRAGHTVDGVLAAGDQLAIGAMFGFRERGLRVPEDVSVIGYNDILVAPYVQPPLTTVRQQKKRMGEEAARLLFSILDGTLDSNLPTHILLPPELVVRESCGAKILNWHVDKASKLQKTK